MACRIVFFVLLAGVAPGCAFHTSVQPEPVNAPLSVSAGPKKEQFGELITGPGQRVSVSRSPAPLPPTTTIPQEPPVPIDPVSPPPVGSVELPKPPGPPSAGTGDEKPEAIFPSIFPSQQGPDSPFLAAARAYERGRSEFASEQLRWFAPVNQAVLAKLLPAAARTAAGPIQDAKEATDLVGRIESAAEVLRPFAELRIETIRLCDRVIDYGDYVPSVSLHAGKHVVLYYEVENVIPEQLATSGDVKYFVGFRAKVRIRGNGKTSEIDSGTYQRQSFRPVRDVYAGMNIKLPSQPGLYTLELELLDAPGRRASRTLEFRVDERK
jgi:hypothetical protein